MFKIPSISTAPAALALCLLALGLSGCGENCSSLEQSECAETSSCSEITGSTPEGEQRYAGCTESGGTAGDAITCAVPTAASEDCLIFSTNLIPEGWEAVDCEEARCGG